MISFIRNLFGKADDVPPQLREFHEKIRDLPPEIRAQFRIGPKLDAVLRASGRFGYDRSNPIPVCLQQGAIEYLACLRCECGEPFMFHRPGSCGSGPDGHVVDSYELVCRSGKHRVTLYVDMYHVGASSLLPDGLGKGSLKGIGLPFFVEGFPEGFPEAYKAAMGSRKK